MSRAPERVVLLGPQADAPDVGRVVAEVAPEGPVAVVSAGWREWEDEDRGVGRSLGRRSVPLRLWGRAEEIWQRDPELAEGHGRLQRRVQALRRAYNMRLAPAMDAWIHLLEAEGDPVVLDPERADALAVVQALDRHHARRLVELRDEYRRAFDPPGRPTVARVREEVAGVLEGVETVVVEGGHVPVLLNRLRLLGMGSMLAGRTVVACSGGAMALAERVVLFHDSPPWGPGHAEVGEVGLALFPDVIPLPWASRRLRLDQPERVGRFARRFAPSVGVVLDPGERLEWRPESGWNPGRARRLTGVGGVEAWRGAA